MKTKQPPIQARQESKSNKFMKAAAAALAIAAAVYFFKDCSEKKHQPSQTPMPRESIVVMPIKPRLSNALLQLPPQEKPSFPTLFEPLVSMEKDLPYESLDCPSTPIEKREWDPTDFKILGENELAEILRTNRNVVLSMGELSTMFFMIRSDEKSSKIFCQDPQSGCPTNLTAQVTNLERNGDARGFVTIINHMDSLNVEWEEKGEVNSLAHVYFEKYIRTTMGFLSPGPSLKCIAKNVFAMRFLNESRAALARMITENPILGQSVLEGLPAFQRTMLMEFCIQNLLRSDNPNTEPLETFFASLSSEDRQRFLAKLDEVQYWYETPDFNLKMAEAAASSATDTDLRSAMQGLAVRWKTGLDDHTRWLNEMKQEQSFEPESENTQEPDSEESR